MEYNIFIYKTETNTIEKKPISLWCFEPLSFGKNWDYLLDYESKGGNTKFFKSEDKYIVLGIKYKIAFDELPFKGYQLSSAKSIFL